MSYIRQIISKTLTSTDFARINSDGYAGGGGQAYIDFSTTLISPAQWDGFFAGIAQKSQRTHGSAWTFSVHSLGASFSIQHGQTIYQRRPASISIGSQKLPANSKSGMRLNAWNPSISGFPDSGGVIAHADDVPPGLLDGLKVFLIRTSDDQIWAGWTRLGLDDVADNELRQLLTSQGGLFIPQHEWQFTDEHPQWPFLSSGGEQLILESLQVEAPDPLWDETDVLTNPEPDIAYSIQAVRKRNQAAARSVRKLYDSCQVSGLDYAFITKKGKPYLEVHHLVPLGLGGADAPHNMIVVSAHIHKMLHHAHISQIDLTKITENKLTFMINGEAHLIKWHPLHTQTILQAVFEE